MSIKVQIVSTVAMLAAVLDELNTLPNRPPSIFMDLEGIKLGRHGSISTLSLYVPPLSAVYLVDVYELGHDTFNTMCTSTRGVSLKDILERADFTKVTFDVRNDSDALFSHYGIRLQGVMDLQVMELARRKGSIQWLSGLAKCVEHDSGLSSAAITEWKAQKAQGAQLLAPEKGGRYEVFNERPLRTEIRQYCTWDVIIMKSLHDKYSSQLNDFWRKKVEAETQERVKQSQSATYDPHGKDRARGPWDPESIREEIDQENEAMLEALDDLRVEVIAAGTYVPMNFDWASSPLGRVAARSPLVNSRPSGARMTVYSTTSRPRRQLPSLKPQPKFAMPAGPAVGGFQRYL